MSQPPKDKEDSAKLTAVQNFSSSPFGFFNRRRPSQTWFKMEEGKEKENSLQVDKSSPSVASAENKGLSKK